MRRPDIKVIDDAFDMHAGYVMNFTDGTFAEFFEDELSVDIYNEKYAFNGTSKAKRFRAFLEVENENPYKISKALRRLWNYRENLLKRQPNYFEKSHEEIKDIKTPFFDLLTRIEGAETLPRTDALEYFKCDETLEELIAAINRDIQVNKPAVALDRLHTYCMKRFAYLLDQRGEPCDRNDPLHSRMGKYAKKIEREFPLQQISKIILKSSISIFDKFNEVRNNQSLAHDNDLSNKAEARFIFDTIIAILRFVKTVEDKKL